MKKRNIQPQQTAPVERPEAGGKSASRDPLAMFAASGGVGAMGDNKQSRAFGLPFAGEDAE